MLWDFNKGEVHTDYQVIALNKTEFLYSNINYFDTYQSAENFCLKHNYKYIIFKDDNEINCELRIIKVISELLN